MSEQISIILKRKLNDLAAFGGLDAETRRNTLKEELQFYVLNFIYHHPKYNIWIMYGGSALRIVHGLDRMSVDLDFEISHAITEQFLDEVKKEIEGHFFTTYGAGADFLTAKTIIGRGLLLKFHVGDELSSGHPSKQVHVKIDLNHFVAPKTVIERRPINRDQLSFVVITYNMASLMASKLAAIFLRGTHGVGDAVYGEKGRDIYDLLWYMNKKIVPDFDYLIAKGIDVKDPRALFDRLTLQMNKVNDKNLEQDLEPLFVDKNYIRNWLGNWHESYFNLLREYRIRTITTLKQIIVKKDFGSEDNYYYVFLYNTQEKESIKIEYIVSHEWFNRKEPLEIDINHNLMPMVILKSGKELTNRDKQFITLFHEKTELYFKKINNAMVQESIATKLIITEIKSEHWNPNEQIVLNKSALLLCDLDDLLK